MLQQGGTEGQTDQLDLITNAGICVLSTRDQVYEKLLVHLGFWEPENGDKFPRYMVTAEEVETEREDTAGMIGQRVDALHEAVDTNNTKVAAVETRLTELHEEMKQLLAAVMTRLGERDGVVVAGAAAM